jgi:hypothetical protein|tara:strand:+ start:2025 stop:2315 length:291 start_codon:yes stop_codon:yes gene_type:complete
MITIIIFYYLLINIESYVINRGLTIKQSFVLLNNINNISTAETLNEKIKNGLNLSAIRNQIKQDEYNETRKNFNISTIREYIRNKLDNNSTNIKNQ